MALILKIRLSRKVIIAVSASLVLFGATGAAALIVGRDAILGPSATSLYGIECTDIVRVADVRNRELPWLRKYIKTASTDGETRLKTALRVAKTMQEKLPAELIHVAVLDENGPEARAMMRGRAIGAEVFLFNDAAALPDVTGKFRGRYYEGSASDAGLFYGDEHELSSDDIEAFAKLMNDPDEMEDCLPPEGGEESTSVSGGHLGSADNSAGSHGEGSTDAGGHEGTTAEGGDGQAETPAEPGFLDKMLNMVGLGPADGGGADGGDGASEDHGSQSPADHNSSDANGVEPDSPGPLADYGVDSSGPGETMSGNHSLVGGDTVPMQETPHGPLVKAVVDVSETADTPVRGADSSAEMPVSKDAAGDTGHKSVVAPENLSRHGDAREPASAEQASGDAEVSTEWDGGTDGQIVIFDGPSEKEMLEWQDDSLEEATVPAPALDHEPVSSVNGSEGATGH